VDPLEYPGATVPGIHERTTVRGAVVPKGGATLLDNTLSLYFTECSVGDDHNTKDSRPERGEG
jgi:hypothetical protein